jgi:hypothetical protein
MDNYFFKGIVVRVTTITFVVPAGAEARVVAADGR